MGRREEAKAERRKRIIDAARDLIRETGDTGLSMRALASRAEVSLATPYNLFGSKRAIVLAVLDDVKDFQARFRVHAGADPVARLFEAAKLVTSYYQADPAFYRTLWVAIFDASGNETRSAIWNPQRAAFWQALITALKEGGMLADHIDPKLLLQNFDFVFRSAMLHWVLGELETSQLQAAVCYGFALGLRGAVAESWAPNVTERVIHFQTELALRTAAAELAAASA